MQKQPHFRSQTGELQASNEAVRAEVDLLNAIVESSTDLMLVKDLQGRIVFANPSALEAIGRPASEVLGRTIAECLENPEQAERIAANLHTVLQKGSPQEFEEAIGSGEKERIFRTLKTPLRDQEGNISGLVAVCRDVTDRKDFERLLNEKSEALAHHIRELEKVNQALKSFTSTVSHDLRVPIRAIQFYAEFLQEDYVQKLDDKGRELIDQVTKCAESASQLIEQLLRLSRIDRAAIAPQPIDMRALVDEVCRMVSDAYEAANVEFRIADLPSAIADLGMIRQVWANLISNAVKFSRVKENAVIEIGARQEYETPLFFVRDNGVGFDPNRAEEIFAGFQRLHDPEKFEGEGIGLATVRRIVERHGGRICADSVPGDGSTFYFQIPPPTLAGDC